MPSTSSTGNPGGGWLATGDKLEVETRTTEGYVWGYGYSPEFYSQYHEKGEGKPPPLQSCLPLTVPRPSSIVLSKANLTIWEGRERAPPCPPGPGKSLGGRNLACVYPMSVWRCWPLCQGEWNPGAGEVLSVFMSGWRQCWLPLSCV